MTEPLNIQRRTGDPEAQRRLADGGLPPLLARLYAARGVDSRLAVDYQFNRLLPPQGLLGIEAMAAQLADAIAAGKRLLIVADYDSDGATACALGIRALRAFGANVDYLVPNRFEFGYGLTPEIVRLAKEKKAPDLIVTVDNGIASVEGVEEANRLGIGVLVTDHHLPGDELPAALAIVNPNQPGCAFADKSLAGVGVMFYVLIALRAELRRRGAFATRAEPNLAALTDLVALGTVADVVRLTANNRILVHQGLARIRQGRAQPGIAALYKVAARDPRRASTYDLGFLLGPRLNAAGRLDDMALGIECLATDDAQRAAVIAQQLDQLNRDRRAIEHDMQADALARLESIRVDDRHGLSLFLPDWHQGVIGILASRLKDRVHRPVFAFARAGEGALKGSGRSIPGLHLRDALDLVSKRHPGLLARFGGHAAAAGVTLAERDLGRFERAFDGVCRELIAPEHLARVIETDGPLAPDELTLESASLLEAEIWGQGFAPPLFDDHFQVSEQRPVGGRHLRMRLARQGVSVQAIAFGQADPMPERVRAVYRLGVDEFNGARRLQVTVERWDHAV